MCNMKLNRYTLSLFDPCKIIVGYTIFFVVRSAEGTDTQEDVLLLSQLCPEDINGDLSTEPSSEEFTDFKFIEEDKPPEWLRDSLLEVINISQYVQEVSEESLLDGSGWWGNVFTPKPTPRSECEDQVEQYLRDLKHFELWAMQMWDATGKPAAGLLSGNSNQLGDYDSCLEVQLAALGVVHGKYCLADIDLEASSASLPSVRTAITKLEAGAFVRSKHSDPGHFAPRWSTLRWGLCVPAACSDQEVAAGLRLYLQAYQLPGVTVDSAIKPGMCHTSQPGTDLPFLTLVTLGFFGGILMLAVVATMVDNITNYPYRDKLKARDRALLAFSLRRNWQILVSQQTDELPVIHGIRSVFTMMLFAAHKMMPLSLTPYSNRSLVTQCSHSVFSSILRASSVFTDSFLQLSAVLAAYNIGRELQRHGSLSWRARILARVIRLTPSLFAVVLFYAYVMEHLGTGPQWASSVTANADLCKANLWKNILYIQNFFLFEDMCAPHTHQLALDMQMFLAAPLVVYSLHHWPRYSAAAICLFQLAVACLRYFTYLHNNLSLFIYHNISLTDLYRTANMSYIQTIQRSIPYMVGLSTGFFLQRVGKIHLSHIQSAAGWVMCVVLAALSVFYPAHLTKPNAVFDVGDSAWYSAFFPITWSVALTWLIVACSSGYGGWLHKVLCQHWLVILSRLSYSIYLIQFIIFYYYVGSIRSSQEFSLLYAIGVYEVGGVLLTSLIVTLLFDLPMQDIKSILLSTRKADKVS